MTRWVCSPCGHGLDTHGIVEDDSGAYLDCIQCQCRLVLPARREEGWVPKVNADVEPP